MEDAYLSDSTEKLGSGMKDCKKAAGIPLRVVDLKKGGNREAKTWPHKKNILYFKSRSKTRSHRKES